MKLSQVAKAEGSKYLNVHGTNKSKFVARGAGKASEVGSRGVIDNDSYDRMVGAAGHKRGLKGGAASATIAGVGTALLTRGKLTRTKRIAASVGAGGILGASDYAAGRSMAQRKGSTPQARYAAERNTVINQAVKLNRQFPGRVKINADKWGSPVIKVESPAAKTLHKKKTAAQVGLANNAFGAAAGAAATRMAFREQKARLKGVPAGMPTVSRTERALRRLKVNPKFILPAVATVAVGSQLANGAMDAQSAQYFGRELKSIRDKEKRMAKSYESPFDHVSVPTSDVGKSLEVSKKARRFDPEADRQRRMGVYQGTAAAGGIGLGAAGGWTGTTQAKKLTRGQINALKAVGTKMRVPAALVGSGLVLGTAAGAIQHRANSRRNQTWT